ncbi:hypothetical protein FRC01_007563 [Tulasnella sp. 417]|nr:hypothetical protein FRC01_007563 [Tulasnella sp. 417]
MEAPNDPPLDVPGSAAEPSMIDTDALDLSAPPLKRKFDALDIEDDAKIASGSGDPRKDEDGAPRTPPSKLPEFKPSPEFWFEDGNIVLLVHDTFFKVHRSRLCCDGSIFATMFTLPQGESSKVDGQSASMPIRFADKPRRFTALLWALYALPAELRSINHSAENCMKLIDIATAAQKYAFKTTEEWALSCLVDLVKTSNHLGERKINPWRIFALATLCNSQELRQAMIDKIRERASQGKLHYSWVVTIGESLSIPELLGAGYYEIVIQNRLLKRTRLAVIPGKQNPQHWNEDGKLNEPMMNKLYVGFCKLVTFKDTLFSTPMPIANHQCPLDPNQCRARWNLLWKEGQQDGTERIPSVHVLGHLKSFADYLRRSRAYPGPCHPAWVASVEAKIKELENPLKLYEFFRV